jgi:hypothetical protein
MAIIDSAMGDQIPLTTGGMSAGACHFHTRVRFTFKPNQAIANSAEQPAPKKLKRSVIDKMRSSKVANF